MRLTVLLVLLGILMPGVADAAAEVGPEGYRESLQLALDDLESGRERAAGAVAARLMSIGPVVLPDGTSVQPDLAVIVAALDRRPPDLPRARIGLRALLDEVDRSLARPGAGRGVDARTRLHQILERPEFRAEGGPDPISSFFRRLFGTLWDWVSTLLAPIGDWLGEQLDRLGVGGIERDRWQQVAAVVGLIVVGGLMVWVVRALRRALGPAAVGIATEHAGPVMAADAARAEAQRLAQKGDYRGAMRALYLAVLLQWDERGRLRFDRALTNREVLARAGDSGEPVLVERLAPLVERFDLSWYGGAPCSAQDYADFAHLAGMAWETAG